MQDKRRINKIWEACNPQGEWFTYALIGSGKNSYIRTITMGAMAEYYQGLIGKTKNTANRSYLFK